MLVVFSVDYSFFFGNFGGMGGFILDINDDDFGFVDNSF